MASTNTSTEASLKDLSEKSVEDTSPTEDSDDQEDKEEKLSPMKTWLLVSSLCVCVLRKIEVYTTDSF